VSVKHRGAEDRGKPEGKDCLNRTMQVGAEKLRKVEENPWQEWGVSGRENELLDKPGGYTRKIEKNWLKKGDQLKGVKCTSDVCVGVGGLCYWGRQKGLRGQQDESGAAEGVFSDNNVQAEPEVLKEERGE